MKRSKKVALGTLMACLITGNVASAETILADDSSPNVVISKGEYVADSGMATINAVGEGTKKKIVVITQDGLKDITIVNNSKDNDIYGVRAREDITSSTVKPAGIGTTVKLGTADTENIRIEVNATKSGTGIAAFKGSQVDVQTKNLVVDVNCVEGSESAGLWVQGNSNSDTVLNIDAENTVINVKAEEGLGNGLVVLSGSKLNIKGNLEVNAGQLLVTRGYAQTKINEDGTGTVKLNGNINFEYDAKTSGTDVNATVDINLNGTDSYWNGNTVIAWNRKKSDGTIVDLTPEQLEVSEVTINLKNGAQWTPSKVIEEGSLTTDNEGSSYVALNNLNLKDGVVNLTTDQAVEVESLSGTGGVINVSNFDNKMEIGAKAADTTLAVQGSSNITDEIAASDNQGKALQKLANVVSTNAGQSVADTVSSAEGTVAGSITATIGQDGNIIQDTIKESKNTSNAGISDMGSLGLVAWRAGNDDMNKRLGELRNSNGEHGVWVRMVRGESEYNSVKNQYNTYQLGYDEKLSTDESWTVGMALSYTEGDSGFDKGSGENKHKGLSIYGSKLNEDGSFIDLIAKYARLDHEYTVAGGVGDCEYEANGYSVSAEYGKRFAKGNGFWIEPQVQLTYGTVGSASYMTEKGARVDQDSMDSLVGRIGFSLGKDIKQGNVYARASYLYDFDGETNIRFTDSNNVSRSMEQDLGGGWFEVGVGTNINLSKATYLYADVERTFGGEVDTPWQYNVGVRYSF